MGGGARDVLPDDGWRSPVDHQFFYNYNEPSVTPPAEFKVGGRKPHLQLETWEIPFHDHNSTEVQVGSPLMDHKVLKSAVYELEELHSPLAIKKKTEAKRKWQEGRS